MRRNELFVLSEVKNNLIVLSIRVRHFRLSSTVLCLKNWDPVSGGLKSLKSRGE